MQFVGIPSVITGSTSASALALAGNVVNPDPSTSNAGTILRRALDGLEGNLYLVMDTKNKRIYATESATMRTNLGTKLNDSASSGGATNALAITPDAGQEGRSLTWTSSTKKGTPNATKKSLADALIASQKPARTVESLVNAILSSVVLDTDAQPQFIAVDQVNKEVVLYEPTNATTLSAALAALVPTANTNTFAVQVTPEADATTPADKPFEGGAV